MVIFHVYNTRNLKINLLHQHSHLEEDFFYQLSNKVLYFDYFSSRTTGSVTYQLRLTFLTWKILCNPHVT